MDLAYHLCCREQKEKEGFLNTAIEWLRVKDSAD